MNKTLIAILTLVSIAAAPALAQTADHPTKQRGQATHARAVDTESNGPYYYSDAYADPYAVIVGNRVVGRDPDANIRLQLKRDFPSDN